MDNRVRSAVIEIARTWYPAVPEVRVVRIKLQKMDIHPNGATDDDLVDLVRRTVVEIVVKEWYNGINGRVQPEPLGNVLCLTGSRSLGSVFHRLSSRCSLSVRSFCAMGTRRRQNCSTNVHDLSRLTCDQSRLDKRCNSVMRLGIRSSPVMRLGKRSDNPVIPGHATWQATGQEGA